MSFHVIHHGQLYRVEVTQENCRIIPLGEPA